MNSHCVVVYAALCIVYDETCFCLVVNITFGAKITFHFVPAVSFFTLSATFEPETGAQN